MSLNKTEIKYNPLCVRQKSNWSRLDKRYKFDNKHFDPEMLEKDIDYYSPKLKVLLDKIQELDKKDKAKYGKKFKHFIFSDIKTAAYGPKMISSALISKGWTLAYDAELKKNSSYGPMELLSNEELLKSKGHNFFLLSSVSVYDKPISVKTKKAILAKFNDRPDNVYGDLARIIVMDSGFKEGIDLFDIKYVHIFEPSVNTADQKQVIGRGTRTCGQKGLDFHPTKGWPLHVFVYDLTIPESLTNTFKDSNTAFELYLKAMNFNINLLNLAAEVEKVSMIGSVDYELNENIHSFSISGDDDSDDEIETPKKKKGGDVKEPVFPTETQYVFMDGKKYKIPYMIPVDSESGETGIALPYAPFTKPLNFENMRTYIQENYSDYKWDEVKMENMCVPKDIPENCPQPKEAEIVKSNNSSILNYTPTQDFIRHYFAPKCPVKGMLLWHSVGTGKTCSAIAAASANFAPTGYTILWVTRTTLKNDIWKNMFGQVCNEDIRNKILAGEEIPTDIESQMRLLSPAWRIRPISYKQFSNLVSKKNEYYKRLVRENGATDPLRKTLIIIDEAHKLYGGGDLSSIERPDMKALHRSLMASYEISGMDSVRLLLMTATPITESPMELIQLVNLCKMKDQQMPFEYDDFTKEYLNEEGTEFTKKGRAKYLDDIAGHISYLNREKDARQFSQPRVEQIRVPLIKDLSDIDKFDITKIKKSLTSELDIPIQKLESDLQESLDEFEANFKDQKPINELKRNCKDYDIPSKKCNAIINKNIKDLKQEMQTYVKPLKKKIADIRDEIKHTKTYKRTSLSKLRKTMKDHPKELERFEKSPYMVLKNDCAKRVKSTDPALLDHPELSEFNDQIKQNRENIERYKEGLAIDIEAQRELVTELKHQSMKRNLSDIEKASLRQSYQDYKKNFKHVKKDLENEVKSKILMVDKDIKKIETARKAKYKTILKTLKKQEKQLKKDQGVLKDLQKTKKKQESLVKSYNENNVTNLVKKYNKIIDQQLKDEQKK
tara:strand:- start:1199 stop:4216 length:3018 start_codon:yes stop_codon:yes gene_type:complete